MLIKAIATVGFGAVFGLMFIVFGVRRIWEGGKGPQKAESIIWGSIGILLGGAFFAGIVWLLTPVDETTTDTRPFTNSSHPQ